MSLRGTLRALVPSALFAVGAHAQAPQPLSTEAAGAGAESYEAVFDQLTAARVLADQVATVRNLVIQRGPRTEIDLPLMLEKPRT